MTGNAPENGEEGTPEEHECEVCGKSFDSDAELRKHVRRIGIVE